MNTNKIKKYSVKEVSVLLLIVIVMSALLDAEGILKWAQKFEIGTTRTILLSATEPVYEFSEANMLTTPRSVLRDIFKDVSGIERDAGFINTDEPFVLDTTNTTKDTATAIDSTEVKEVYSKDKPLKVLLIGDSMMGPGFGAMLLREMEQDSLIAPTRYFKHSSGLSRPDFYNWFYQIKQIFSKDRYDAVVVMMGTNDAQSFEVNKKVYKFGKEDWISIYRNRVNAFVDTLNAHTHRIFWLGMPPMRESGFDGRMETITQIFEDEVSADPKGCFISTAKTFSDENGKYSTYLKFNGKNQRMRANDGIHMTNAGGIMLTEIVVDSIKSFFIFEEEVSDSVATVEDSLINQ